MVGGAPPPTHTHSERVRRDATATQCRFHLPVQKVQESVQNVEKSGRSVMLSLAKSLWALELHIERTSVSPFSTETENRTCTQTQLHPFGSKGKGVNRHRLRHHHTRLCHVILPFTAIIFNCVVGLDTKNFFDAAAPNTCFTFKTSFLLVQQSNTEQEIEDQRARGHHKQAVRFDTK